MGELEARLESWRAVAAWLAWQQRQAAQTIATLEAELVEVRARRPRQAGRRRAGSPDARRGHRGLPVLQPRQHSRCHRLMLTAILAN